MASKIFCKCSLVSILGRTSLRSASSLIFNSKTTHVLCRQLPSTHKISAFSTSTKCFNQEIKDTSGSEECSNKENIGEGTWTEVYKGILSTQIKLVKTFSLGTSVIGILCQPLLFYKLSSMNVMAVMGMASFVGFFTFVTPIMIHWVSKKYVTKLEYDEIRDIYAATTISFLLREHKIEFNLGDVIRPTIPGVFTTIKVRGRPLFVDPEMFNDFQHYIRIMGFDKPVNLRPDPEYKKES